MKVTVLSTKMLFLRTYYRQVLRGPAPYRYDQASEIPYWRERGWRQEGRTYRGTYKTAYGSFIGRIEQVRPGNFRLYIFDLRRI